MIRHGGRPALAMTPEGSKIIAHGFSRGKRGDGTQGALEGRYERLSPSLIGAPIRRRTTRGFSVGGQKSLAKRVSPLLGLPAAIALYPRLEAVGYDLPAPSGRNPRRTPSPSRCFGPRPRLAEDGYRRCRLNRCRNSRRARHAADLSKLASQRHVLPAWLASTRRVSDGLDENLALTSVYQTRQEASPRSGRKDSSPRWSRQAEPWGTETKSRQALKGRRRSYEASSACILDSIPLVRGSALHVPSPLSASKGLTLSNNDWPALIWTAQRHAVPLHSLGL